jgi:hypothetical protein
MARVGKKPTDDQLLEGGGGGGGFRSIPSSTLNPRPTGSRSAKDYKEKEDKTSEVSGEMSFGSPRGRSSYSGDRTPRTSDDYAGGGMTEDDKKAAKYRAEAKTGGTDAPAPKEVLQEMADKKAAAKAATAPTTKTTMGKPFAKGGMTASSRADGCAQRGKTRGTIIR